MGFLFSLFYRGLFVIAGATLALFFYQLLTGDQALWETYGRIYLYVLLGYTWLLFVILFLGELRPKAFPRYDNERITVVIPCYNEKPELLRRSVQSVAAAKGNKEIVIIDDGSTNGIAPLLKELAFSHRIQIHVFDRNRGKRHALHYFVKEIADAEFVVTIDSDTVLDPDALVRIVEPLKDPAVGATTGDVRLLNEHENWLTRMIATYYWIGLNVYKQAQSVLGHVVCCSGCLAAYRTELIREIIDEFVNQEFYGEKCTHSEDRHLTNLVLKRGYKVHYVPQAISYTETPSTVRGFLKQQQRWKRGYIRESVYTLTYAWRTRPILFAQIFLWDLTAPFFTLGMRLAVLLTLVVHPLFFLTYILPAWIMFMLTRYILVVLRAPDKIPGLFTYMIFYEVFLYWMNLYALFTVRNKSWITR